MQDHQEDFNPFDHSTEEKDVKKSDRNLFVRNILNTVFIIVALAAMISIGLHFGEDETPMWCYLLGVIAVIIKMCESMLRMPGLNKSNSIRSHRRHRR